MNQQVRKLLLKYRLMVQNIIIQCESGLEEETTYSIVVTRWGKTGI